MRFSRVDDPFGAEMRSPRADDPAADDPKIDKPDPDTSVADNQPSLKHVWLLLNAVTKYCVCASLK